MKIHSRLGEALGRGRKTDLNRGKEGYFNVEWMKAMEKATRDGRGWKISVSFVVGAGGGSEKHMNHWSFPKFSVPNLRVENTYSHEPAEAEDIKKRCKNTQKESETEVAQSCLTLCDPMDGCLPGSEIHGIFQARILEWAAISFSRGSSQPRDRTCVFCIADRRLTVWAKKRFNNTQKNCTNRSSWPRKSRWCDHSPRARHPGMWSQVGFRKHRYKRS